MRRAGGQFKGPLALAALVALTAGGRPAGAVPAPPAPVTRPASVPALASAPAPARAPARALARAAVPTQAPPGAGPTPAGGPVIEATCATAPLGVRVVAVHRESADSIRVEFTLANLTPAGTWKPGSPAAASMAAAIAALDGLSMLSADGRRRMFALRDSAGQRVGSVVAAPGPGKPERVWVRFPAAAGPLSLLLPGFAPLSGLVVAPLAGRSEP